MLGDSPITPSLNMANPDNSFSPTPGALETVAEELAEDDLGGYKYGSHFPDGQQEPQMSLAAELGVESPPDTPLQEKRVEPNVVAPVVVAPANLFNRQRVFHHPDSVASKKTNAFSAAEKGKAKAVDVAPATRAPRTSGLGEKENSNSKEKKKPLALTGNVVGPARKVLPTAAGGKPTSSNKTAGKPTVAPTPSTTSVKARGPIKPPASSLLGGGGPRRVLIGSADAPPIGKGWKG